MTDAASLWLGPQPAEARAAYQRARESGMTALRALVVGNIASHRDCWAFRKRLADKAGCSVRTVQRAITQAARLGLIGVARARRGEKPPGLETEVPCGWSHRWTIGWGRAGAAVKRAIDAARARWMVRHAAPSSASSSCPTKSCDGRGRDAAPARTWTAAELDAELERLASGEGPPLRPKPPP